MLANAHPNPINPINPIAQARTRHGAGFGLGLRTPHYGDFLATRQNLDWLEIITDNFLVEGGKPLRMLDRMRQDYPMAMHGVAMSVGAAQGVDLAYLKKVKALADRIEPLWVSDHLCWIGPGPEQLHDLYPLPYTDEAARHVIIQIQRAQDLLQRRLVIENVSSYIDFAGNSASEWQFLSHVANSADCLLLVDVNNIYVSSVNHGFDPLDYLDNLPPDRVQQIHLAGHSDHGSYIVDTHDHPVAEPVWRLYAQACRRFGAVATMIERDDNIPALAELLDELDLARDIASKNLPGSARHAVADTAAKRAMPAAPCWSHPPEPAGVRAVSLEQVQQRLSRFVLDRTESPHDATALVQTRPFARSEQRLGIYHHAYRARLVEVLTDSFAKTNLYMGSDAFSAVVTAFAVQNPPLTRSLGRYGAGLPDYLAAAYPDNPELRELAQLDWDLRSRFDGADAPALDASTAANTDWLDWLHPLHPSVVLRSVTCNVAQLWRAMDAEQDVPEVQYGDVPKTLVVWRKGLLPHFQTLEVGEASFLNLLADGQSIGQAVQAMTANGALTDPQTLGQWLQEWLENGLLLLKSLK